MSLWGSKHPLRLTAYCKVPGLEARFQKHVLAVLRTPLLLNSSFPDTTCRPEGFGVAHTVRAHVGHAACFRARCICRPRFGSCGPVLERVNTCKIQSYRSCLLGNDIGRRKERTRASVSLRESSRLLSPDVLKKRCDRQQRSERFPGILLRGTYQL